MLIPRWQLGFNSEKRLEINNDIFVNSDIIINSMDTYGFEIQNKNVILHFLQSAINLQGLYSFNKLWSKFKEINPPFEYV